MIVSLRYLLQHPKRIHKFQITDVGDVVRSLPDLMKCRHYKRGKLIWESEVTELPMDNDILEFDGKKEEWFIVKEVVK